MESGGIELRGEVGHSNRSGWHFFRPSSWAPGEIFFSFFLFHISDIYKFRCRDFYTAFFVIFWSDSPFCFTFSAANLFVLFSFSF